MFSRPDEGSIAEKESVGLAAGEKGEKEGRGFFSPEIVDKELRSLEAERRDERGEGYL